MRRKQLNKETLRCGKLWPGVIKVIFYNICMLILLIKAVDATAANLYFLYAIDGYQARERFESLSAIFISGDELFVADIKAGSISIFNLDGTPVFKFGKEKGLTRPIDFIVLNDQIYVVEENSNKIAVFNMRGDKIREISAPFPKFMPVMITTDEGKDGFVVVDKYSLKICLFDKDGKYLYDFGGKTLFKSLSGIAFRHGKIYVSSIEGNSIVKTFDITGRYLSGFGKIGEGRGFFSMPSGINVDSEKKIWITDAFKHRVTVHDESGKMLEEFGGGSVSSERLNYPYRIKIKGDICFVLGKGLERKRVKVFKYVSNGVD